MPLIIILGEQHQHSLRVIAISSSFGPIFGAGADLSISSECNENSDSYSNFPHSYGEPNQYPVSLAGDYHFKVDDYEVFIPRTAQQLNGR